MIEDEDYRQLKNQLDAFVSQARENEQKMRRFHAQELRLIGTRSLTALVQNLLYNYRTAFSLDAVSLVLFDPQYEVTRILEEEGTRLAELSNLFFIRTRSELDAVVGGSVSPQLGAYDEARHRALFAKTTPKLHSVAVLPLVRYGDLIGSLNLGSISAERFAEHAATDFLQRLCTIVAICIENTTNHERLKRVGLTDSLTGINNRRFFDQRIGEEVARCLRTHEPMACLFMDIDHFKHINDQYGHQVGDQVLRKCAALIREQLRNSDVLARYGGEEFAAVLSYADTRTAFEIAERIRDSIARHDFTCHDAGGHSTLAVTLSIGVSGLSSSTVPTDTETLTKKLLTEADNALYSAKHSGRDRVMLADELDDPQAPADLQIMAE
jgi:diguanylate cyclase (GGDEF)-like protein